MFIREMRSDLLVLLLGVKIRNLRASASPQYPAKAMHLSGGLSAVSMGPNRGVSESVDSASIIGVKLNARDGR